jgi:hypothetical protein
MPWGNLAVIRAATLFAGAALLAAGGPALADSRSGGGPNWNQPRPPSRPPSTPTAGAAATPRPPASYAIVVVVGAERPQAPAPAVAIRGPNGAVRSYRLEDGASVILPRQITIRAGEAVTIRFLPSAPAR